jgi:deoxycytidylate deaminase/dephospho-CoA kinase
MNIEKIYELRKSFTIIALTGRKGSGCSEVANRLKEGFSNDNSIFRNPSTTNITHNSYRKYRIVYDYSKENFKPHILISYKKILFLFILTKNYDDFIIFLKSENLRRDFAESRLAHLCDFDDEIKKISYFKNDFDFLHNEIDAIWKKQKNAKARGLKDLYQTEKFQHLANCIFEILEIHSTVKRNKLLQLIGNNLRKSSEYDSFSNYNLDNVFSVVDLINDIIKAFARENKSKKTSTEIVIDSLRNPLEIMFFRQRFSAFYTIAINRTEEIRKKVIDSRYKKDKKNDIDRLISEEYNGAKAKDFYKQNVSQCIQNADIHLAFKDYEEIDLLNKEVNLKNENVSPYFSWQMQLLKFLSLIDQPGIVTPSPEERCMQLAFTAKYNSGCISRQVGAAITDENYAIKAIGWNNTPEGQVPCSLRNADDLISGKDDYDAFTTYEKSNPEFQKAFKENYANQRITDNRKDLKGRNICFCFKGLINSYSEGKNQVHTRSLHAEESAFLQITKYGGQGILNGKLFTTASPCELCSKKAYQLGIKVIYYIDPYPGISLEHILTAGSNDRNPKLRLFHGAIGNAYHWLYEPFMAYKDELNLILGNNIKDLASIKEELIVIKDKELLSAKEDLQALTEENEKLKEIIASKTNQS